MQNITRIVNSGFNNFKRNSWLSIATTGVMVLALLLINGLVILNVFSNAAVASLQEKVDITAYFKFQANEDQILSVKNDLAKMSEIKAVNYISREQALKDFKQKHEGDQLIEQSLSELDENPLQASLNIKTHNSSQYASVASFLENNKFTEVIDKVNFYENQTVIQKIEGITSGLKNGGTLVTLLIALMAVVITFNTIRMTIYAQRQEIEIMKLVGASNWHIRGPFLVEGGMYGLGAALITLIITYPVLYFVSSKLYAFLPSVDIFDYYVSYGWQIFLLVIGSGVALGVLSSFIAIRRYLKI